MPDLPSSTSRPLSILSTEEQLQAFQLMMEHVTDYAIYLFDPLCKIVFWNRGAERLMGYSEVEILGQSANLIFTPEDRERQAPEQEMEKALSEGRADDERWHMRKDGSRFWGSGVVTPLRDDAGQLRWYVKILRDLTDRDRLQALIQETAILQERTRMARELHDTLAQSFTAIKLQLDAAEEALHKTHEEAPICLVRARDVATEGLQEARRAIQALRSTALNGKSLASALQSMLEQTTEGMRIQVACRVEGDAYSLPESVEGELYRIAQEALTNALRHSSAQQIIFTLVYTPTTLRLQMTDNGTGFDPKARWQGFGLQGMRERAGRIGARFMLDSRPGEGTSVLVTLPTLAFVMK